MFLGRTCLSQWPQGKVLAVHVLGPNYGHLLSEGMIISYRFFGLDTHDGWKPSNKVGHGDKNEMKQG